MAAESASSRTRRGSPKATDQGDQSRKSVLTLPTGAVGRNVSAVRDVVTKSMLAPLNAVLLSRDRIEEVVDDAVRRGRMTREDAQHMVQTLLQYGARQTDDFLSDLERLLGRGEFVERSGSGSGSDSGSRRARRPRPRRPASNLPINNYDELSAAQVQDKLDGLSAAQLRKLRDYERRHANRKTVLDRIERKLR